MALSDCHIRQCRSIGTVVGGRIGAVLSLYFITLCEYQHIIVKVIWFVMSDIQISKTEDEKRI